MSRFDEQEYHRNRARQEWAAARVAASPVARGIHEELASRHAAMAPEGERAETRREA